MNRRMWTAAEIEVIKARYPRESTAAIAASLVGRTVAKVHAAAQRLGIKKSTEYMDEQNRLKKGVTLPGMEKHHFPKGHVPFNKGLRRPGYYAGRMRETQFKPGQMAGAAQAKWRPIGTITADADGYLRIKVRERVPGANENGWNSKVWPAYHRYVWEQANGPIPPGHIVVFKDRDRSNCKLDNLELITLAENARRNVMWANYPRELAEAIHANGMLKRRLKKLNGKEHDQGPAGSPVRDNRGAQGSR